MNSYSTFDSSTAVATNIQFCRHWGSRNSRRIFELLLCRWMRRRKRDCGSDAWYGCWGCRHCQHRWLGDNWSDPGKHIVQARLGQAWISGNILTSNNLLKRNRSRISYIGNEATRAPWTHISPKEKWICDHKNLTNYYKLQTGLCFLYSSVSK